MAGGRLRSGELDLGVVVGALGRLGVGLSRNQTFTGRLQRESKAP
jgi:hypothetical protein